MTELLAVRHAPRTSLDSLLGAVEVASLRQWLGGGARGPGRVALVLGGPGSGVTTLLALLVKELGMEAVWARAATPRLRVFLGDSGSSDVAVNGKRKVVIIDEYDIINGDAASSVDVSSFLKRKPAAPVVLLGHTVRSLKTLDAAGKDAAKFVFQRPSWATVHKRLTKICEADGIDASAAQLEELARTVKGDVRCALAALDMFARKPSNDTTIEVRDVDDEGLEVVDFLLKKPVAVTEALRLYANDAAVVSNGLSENYTDVAADIETCSRMADAFSDADIIDEKIFARQAWDLLDVHAVFAVAAPVTELHRFGTARPSNKPVEKFGTVWSKMYNACAKQKNVRAIRFWRAEAGLADAPAQDLAVLRPAIQDAIARGHAAEAKRLAGGVGGPAEVLALMRLSKTEYKQTTHARLKKLLL